jgi:hypothetical protein
MSENQRIEPNEITVLESSALQAVTSAEIDVQIATAHKYPRSLGQFVKRATEMATLDADTAAACIYRKPVGKNPNGSVKYAEGKSVRLAEIVGACYGNLRVGSMLIEQDPKFVKSRGFAHDLETNFACSSEVVEATVYKDGKPYSDQMRITIAKATLAKARRDATFQVIPGAICKGIELAARKTALGTSETLGARRAAVMDWIGKAGISEERFFKALDIRGVDDIGADILATITGIRTAIRDGDTTPDEAFPLIEKTTVSAPKAKAEPEQKKEEPKAAEPEKPAAPAAPTKREVYDNLVSIILKSPKAKQEAHHKSVDKYLSDKSKTLLECVDADFDELIKLAKGLL